jgi:hypothetical protein
MPNEIHLKIIKVYGESSPLFSTFKKWAAEFKRGRTSLKDDPCEGCPKSTTPPEIIEQVHNILDKHSRQHGGGSRPYRPAAADPHYQTVYHKYPLAHQTASKLTL